MRIEVKNAALTIHPEEAAGLICVSWETESRGYAFHLLVKPKYWTWGRHIDSGIAMDEWGCGPLFLFVRAWF